MRGGVTGVLTILCLGLIAGCLDTPEIDLNQDERLLLVPDALEVVRIAHVDPMRWSGEPSILALDDGTLLITGVSGFTRYAEDPTDIPARFGQSYIWRSTDGGATWTFVDSGLPLPGPVDTYAFYRNAVMGVEGDLAKDADGRVYFVDMTMLAGNGLSSSTDNGATWTATQNPLVGTPLTDRPWVAGVAADEVYVKYLATTSGFRVARSADAGLTFLEDIALPACSQADLAVDRATGDVLLPCAAGEEVSFLRTPNGGAMDWTRHAVATAAGPVRGGFPSMAVAGEGHYVLTWVESVDEGMRTVVTASTDAGETWSEPLVVSTANRTAIFPWVAANPDGEVGVVWYEADQWGDPNTLQAEWRVHHARFQLDADGLSGPAVTTVTEDPVHVGAICNAGLGCVLDGRANDRRLLDFFEIDVDLGGAHHITWTSTQGEVPTIWYGRLEGPAGPVAMTLP